MDGLFGALSARQRRVLAVAIVAGGGVCAATLRRSIKQAQKEQKTLTTDVQKSAGTTKKSRVAVDQQFVDRLVRILSICVPWVFSKEAILILVQGGFLVSRTLLTLHISKIEGAAGRALTSQNFPAFGRTVFALAAVGIPAAVVNSALKFMQKRIQLAFQERLTTHLHKNYCSNRAYYAASTLGGLTNADQRITEDVEKFAFAISELYSYTFKPLLDVILFTRALAPVMGYKGQLGLYTYYVIAGMILKALSPPLAQMTANESALTGSFRAAHQRLVTHSEEIAYNDPPGGTSERLILNQHLGKLLRYVQLSAFQRSIQQVADGYFVKYLASAVSLIVYAAPLYFKNAEERGSQGQLTQDYIRAMRLLQNTSRGIGDLVLVYKRITSLAGHTSRVAELLEQVAALSKEDAEHKELFRRNISTDNMLLVGEGEIQAYAENPLPSPRRSVGDAIKFHRIALNAPDGTPLVRELTFEVCQGRSVMLMGPNGSGKSSLLRVLAGLWPVMSGTITTPPRSEMFYLSQRPYLVTGTLRDQLLYPDPPRKTWTFSSRDDRRSFVRVKGRGPNKPDDARLLQCLQQVELEYLATRGEGWDQFQKWEETLSGGERQRLAMARLLYHRPKFAVLDEATSAVNAEGETKLYEACCRSGITMLSIGHRPSLKRFHSFIVHFDGTQKGQGWSLETVST